MKLSESIDILHMRPLLEEQGFGKTEASYLQAELLRSRPEGSRNIEVSSVLKLLAKTPIKEEPKPKEETYPKDDMLDGWDEDFDLKDTNPPPKTENKQAFDDYDDFETPAPPPPPKPVATKPQTSTKLDDYLDEF